MSKHSFDPIGKIFGRLHVLAEAPRKISPSGISLRVWHCQCVCGRFTRLTTSQICGKRPSQSCGCLIKDRAIERSTVHGHAARGKRPPEYIAWKAMRRRCSVKKGHPDFPYYAGLGVKVCARWDDFTSFLKDMGNKPSPQHSLDRIDCDGDYEPSNCRWATPTEQSRNRRSMGGNWRRPWQS